MVWFCSPNHINGMQITPECSKGRACTTKMYHTKPHCIAVASVLVPPNVLHLRCAVGVTLADRNGSVFWGQYGKTALWCEPAIMFFQGQLHLPSLNVISNCTLTQNDFYILKYTLPMTSDILIRAQRFNIISNTFCYCFFFNWVWLKFYECR